jgi:hypothetical protein
MLNFVDAAERACVEALRFNPILMGLVIWAMFTEDMTDGQAGMLKGVWVWAHVEFVHVHETK